MKQTILSVFILMTIIPSFWVALSSNIVHAAFSLLFTFFGIAGLYVLLGADFIGVVQVINKKTAAAISFTRRVPGPATSGR